MPEKRRKTIKEINEIIMKAAEKARRETDSEPEPEVTQPLKWPVNCIVGPGLEGAIACESKVGYVNGAKGWLIYRGYDIFSLCANSTFEEVSYLLLHGELPDKKQLKEFGDKLVQYRLIPNTSRLLMGFSVESMNTMAALRLGTDLMRQEFAHVDKEDPDMSKVISADEDSIPMETKPKGEEHAIYEFKRKKEKPETVGSGMSAGNADYETCYRLIAGVGTLTGMIARLRQGKFPIAPNPDLSHAANLLYMMTGKVPDPVAERIMDICLILHADHGMNASTFASLVVASTLSDMYFSVGSGIAALNGPLHGGANEYVLRMLNEVGSADNVKTWYEEARKAKKRIMGFGHRVYKAYDPRARVLGPLAKYLARHNEEAWRYYATAEALEKKVVAELGMGKKIFPNVDFYSGIVYSSLGIPPEFFTPIFAVSRVSGWTARVMEYLQNNRIFRPRAMYTGQFNMEYMPMENRTGREE